MSTDQYMTILMELKEMSDRRRDVLLSSVPKEKKAEKATRKQKHSLKGYNGYHGGLLNNKPHGIGIFSSEKGIYNGEFFAGKRHGYGKRIYNEGYIYEGMYFAGKPHGPGRLISPTGEITEIESFNGKRVSLGTTGIKPIVPGWNEGSNKLVTPGWNMGESNHIPGWNEGRSTKLVTPGWNMGE